MKYLEIIADNLSKAGWSWGYVSAVDSSGRTIWTADAHRDDSKRFVVRADEKLTTFPGTGIGDSRRELSNVAFTKSGLATQFAPQGCQAEQSATEQRNCRACVGYCSGKLEIWTEVAIHVVKKVTRRKSEARSTPRTIVSKLGSSCNRRGVNGEPIIIAAIEAAECITTRRQKDRRDRDIPEAVDESCASAGGDRGLCHQRAGAGRDAYDVRRVQSVVTLIPETELGDVDRAADSKCPTFC
jgi:hypothetical protein